MDRGVFHLGDVTVVVLHPADDISMGIAGGCGQGTASEVEGGLRLPRGQPNSCRFPIVVCPKYQSQADQEDRADDREYDLGFFLLGLHDLIIVPTRRSKGECE